MWHPQTLSQAADAAARWEAARPLARGSERHAVAVRQVGAVSGGGPTRGSAPDEGPDLERIVQRLVDQRLAGPRPWQAAPEVAHGGPRSSAPIRNFRGGEFGIPEASTLPGEVLQLCSAGAPCVGVSISAPGRPPAADAISSTKFGSA